MASTPAMDTMASSREADEHEGDSTAPTSRRIWWFVGHEQLDTAQGSWPITPIGGGPGTSIGYPRPEPRNRPGRSRGVARGRRGDASGTTDDVSGSRTEVSPSTAPCGLPGWPRLTWITADPLMFPAVALMTRSPATHASLTIVRATPSLLVLLVAWRMRSAFEGDVAKDQVTVTPLIGFPSWSSTVAITALGVAAQERSRTGGHRDRGRDLGAVGERCQRHGKSKPDAGGQCDHRCFRRPIRWSSDFPRGPGQRADLQPGRSRALVHTRPCLPYTTTPLGTTHNSAQMFGISFWRGARGVGGLSTR